jgi:putative transposase
MSPVHLDALRMAIGIRGPGAEIALVHHADQGSQVQCMSFDYTQTLDDHDVLQSTGSVGDAYDNALAGAWVDSLKTELIADRVWRTRPQPALAVVEYIGWFNHARFAIEIDTPRERDPTRARPSAAATLGPPHFG